MFGITRNTLKTTLKYFFFLSFVLIVNVLAAQNLPRIEGLRKILDRGTTDSMFIALNIEIADEFIFNNPDTAAYFTSRALERAEKLGNRAAMAKAENFLGIINYSKGYMFTSLEHYQRSQNLYKSIGDNSGAVKATNNIAIVYTNLNDHDKAISMYEEAYKTNMELNQIDEAASNVFNIAAAYFSMKNYPKLREKIEQLEEFNRVSPSSIDACFMKSEIFVIDNQLDSALFCLNKAHDISVQENDEYFLASIILRRAEVYMMLKDYNRAMIDLGQVERIIYKNEFNDIKLDWLDVKSKFYAEQGLYNNAYKSKEEYLALKDSLDQLNNFNRISELNAKYEMEKKESEIAKQSQLLDQQSAQFRLIIILAIALLAISSLIIYNLLKKRRLTRLLQVQNNEIKIARHKVISSINYARRIQASILPSQDEFHKYFQESFILFKPKDIVSGDFYWYKEINGRLFVAAVDCTGHGVPGAFMSLIANSSLNKVVFENAYREPSVLLNKLHTEIIQMLNQERDPQNAQDGMDMSLCIIDTTKRRIDYSGANLGIFMMRNKELIEFKSSPISLGGLVFEKQFGKEQAPFVTETIDYEAGDVLYMYSDGFCDQLGGENHKKFNKTKFKQLLLDLADKSLNDGATFCQECLDEWKGTEHQTDDILIIGTRF